MQNTSTITHYQNAIENSTKSKSPEMVRSCVALQFCLFSEFHTVLSHLAVFQWIVHCKFGLSFQRCQHLVLLITNNLVKLTITSSNASPVHTTTDPIFTVISEASPRNIDPIAHWCERKFLRIIVVGVKEDGINV